MMGHPTGWWAGEGGAAYLKRNRVDWRARIPFWKTVLDMTGARSVYEFGCNAGFNLSAIRRAYPDVRCCGHDVNEAAINQAQGAGLFHVRASRTAAEVRRDLTTFPVGERTVWPDDTYELAFTAGVLIHIPPADLEAFMREVVRVSAQYVLAIEYAAEREEEIEYRGERNLLWRRPYGELYQQLGLRLVATLPPEQVGGFDNCHAWLLEKP